MASSLPVRHLRGPLLSVTSTISSFLPTVIGDTGYFERYMCFYGDENRKRREMVGFFSFALSLIFFLSFSFLPYLPPFFLSPSLFLFSYHFLFLFSFPFLSLCPFLSFPFPLSLSLFFLDCLVRGLSHFLFILSKNEFWFYWFSLLKISHFNFINFCRNYFLSSACFRLTSF